MRKIPVETVCKRLLADVYTPVGIYLRLRDQFRDTLLLESTDHHAAENSYSFICINAIAGMEITALDQLEFKYPGSNPERKDIPSPALVLTTKASGFYLLKPVCIRQWKNWPSRS